MRAIALLGSPRKRGNSDLLAEAVLRGAEGAGAVGEKVYLDDYTIRPIGEVCDTSRQRDDPRADDDFPGVLSRFLEADLVVLATPVYWAGVSAQLKCPSTRRERSQKPPTPCKPPTTSASKLRRR